MSYDEKLEQLHQKIIKCALEVCENAAYLPDGNAQFTTELANNLGQAMCDLADYEEIKYRPWLRDEQTGLSSAQVALQRLNMPDNQLKIERLIDAADRLYLAFFDEVIIPGVSYRRLSLAEAEEITYVSISAIEEFQSLCIRGLGMLPDWG